MLFDFHYKSEGLLIFQQLPEFVPPATEQTLVFVSF